MAGESLFIIFIFLSRNIRILPDKNTLVVLGDIGEQYMVLICQLLVNLGVYIVDITALISLKGSGVLNNLLSSVYLLFILLIGILFLDLYRVMEYLCCIFLTVTILISVKTNGFYEFIIFTEMSIEVLIILDLIINIVLENDLVWTVNLYIRVEGFTHFLNILSLGVSNLKEVVSVVGLVLVGFELLGLVHQVYILQKGNVADVAIEGWSW